MFVESSTFWNDLVTPGLRHEQSLRVPFYYRKVPSRTLSNGVRHGLLRYWDVVDSGAAVLPRQAGAHHALNWYPYMALGAVILAVAYAQSSCIETRLDDRVVQSSLTSDRLI